MDMSMLFIICIYGVIYMTISTKFTVGWSKVLRHHYFHVLRQILFVINMFVLFKQDFCCLELFSLEDIGGGFQKELLAHWHPDIC